MDTNELYEVKAEAFRRMTGHMAPGKDAPSASYPAPYEERVKAWEQWQNDNGNCIRAMLLAFDSVIESD